MDGHVGSGEMLCHLLGRHGGAARCSHTRVGMGQQVTVTLAGTTRTVKADSEGRWKVYMPKMQAGGPYTLRVGQQEIKDVMVGDVFLCSGQSNMELQVKRCMDLVGHKVEGYTNPMVRYVKLPHQYWGRLVL